LKILSVLLSEEETGLSLDFGDEDLSRSSRTLDVFDGEGRVVGNVVIMRKSKNKERRERKKAWWLSPNATFLAFEDERHGDGCIARSVHRAYEMVTHPERFREDSDFLDGGIKSSSSSSRFLHTIARDGSSAVDLSVHSPRLKEFPQRSLPQDGIPRRSYNPFPSLD
jgi:hypothetical protein